MIERRIQEKRLTLPNAITMIRIIGTFFLLFLEVFSEAFYVIYTICGISDVLDGFTARNKPVHVKCKIDGYDWNPQARTLLDGSKCPCCTPKGRTPIVVGINDLQTTHPIIASWVKDKTLHYMFFIFNNYIKRKIF